MASPCRAGVFASQRLPGIRSAIVPKRKMVNQQRWEHSSTDPVHKGQAAVDEMQIESSLGRSKHSRAKLGEVTERSSGLESLSAAAEPRGNRKGARRRFSGLVPYSTTTESLESTSEALNTTGHVEPKSTSRDSYPQPEKPSFFLQEKARVVLERQVAAQRQSTLTATEESVLEDIWKIVDPNIAHTPRKAPKSNQLDTDYKNLLALFSSVPKPNEADTYAASQPHPSKSMPLGKVQQPAKQQALHNVLPFSGGQEFGVSQKSADESLVTEEDSAVSGQLSAPADPIHDTASRVIEDISRAMDKALQSKHPSPEQAVWTVCEEKIFPLIKLLTTARPNLASAPSTTSSHTSSQPGPHPLVPSTVPLVPFLSIAYPAALLLALRTYIVHYPYSPYPLSLLPKIKSFGPTSYVLGVNTHFYNTLLMLRWDVYSDLHGISTLLAEMQGMGLVHDTHTRKLLKRMAKERRMDLGGIEYPRNDDPPVHKGSAAHLQLEQPQATAAETLRKSIKSIGHNRERGKMWWLRPLINRQWAVIQEWKTIISRRLADQQAQTEVEEEDAPREKFGKGDNESKSESESRTVGKTSAEDDHELHDFYALVDDHARESARQTHGRDGSKASRNRELSRQQTQTW